LAEHEATFARIGDDGHLRIVDRKKELIINAAEDMVTRNHRGPLEAARYGQACAFGNGRRTTSADRGSAIAAAYATDDELQAEVRAGVDRANARLARVEQIKRFAILADEWCPTRRVTPT